MLMEHPKVQRTATVDIFTQNRVGTLYLSFYLMFFSTNGAGVLHLLTDMGIGRFLKHPPPSNSYFKCFLKNLIVRSQANFAAAALYRPVVSL